MEILDVLDNAEKLQMKIIRFVWLNGGQVSLKKIEEHVNISNVSVLKYLTEIKDVSTDISGDISWKIKDKKVYFSVPSDFNLKKFYFHYLSDSMNYNIFISLIKYEGISMTKMCDKLSISESSLFRRLKEINRLIEPFDIQLRNGKLYGEELKIRHFLFEFYWHTVPINVFEEDATDAAIIEYIDQLSTKIELPIKDTNYYSLYLWMMISKERVTYHSDFVVDKSNSYNKVINDELYKKIKAVSAEFSLANKVPYFESDALFLYGFLLSNYVFEDYQFEDDHHLFTQKNYFQDVVQLNKETLNTIETIFDMSLFPDKIKWRLNYILFQTHFKLIYVNSSLVYFGEENLMREEDINPNKKLRDIASKIIENHQEKYKVSISDSFYDILFWRYMTILKFVEANSRKKLKIGMKLHVSYLVRMGISQVLEEYLSDEFNIMITNAVEDEAYDLLLIDNVNQKDKYHYKDYYVMGTIISQYDIRKIKQKFRDRVN